MPTRRVCKAGIPTTLMRMALAPALAIVSACSPDPSIEYSAVRDSAGVTIVETVAPSAEWRLSAEPVLQIGVVDGDDAYQFSSIAYAGRLGDGRVVVVDRQSYEIRFFDQTGRHTSTLGGRGAGPGEFRGFAHVVRAGDSLLVYDAWNRRLVLIGPDATVVDEQSVQNHPAFASFGLDNNVIGATADGRVVTALTQNVNPPAVLNTMVYGRDTVAIVGASRNGESIDTIAMVGGGEYLFHDAASSPVGPAGPRSGWSRRGVSFGYYPYYAILRDGVAYANGERAGFEVLRLNEAAQANRIMRMVRRTDARAIRVSDVAERYAEWIGGLVRADGDNPAEAMARVRSDFDKLPRDHLVPFIDEMIADSEGRIWQRDSLMPWAPDETPRTWVVYAADGHAIARIVVPSNFRITQIEADHIVGVRRDEADVPFVAVHRILR